ncbi:hypothetical protein SLE2022_051080 [Rubroshorea leprosula]
MATPQLNHSSTIPFRAFSSVLSQFLLFPCKCVHFSLCVRWGALRDWNRRIADAVMVDPQWRKGERISVRTMEIQ